MTNPKDETQRTHWEGCWKTYGHHDCAVERVVELEAEIEARGPVAVTRRVDLTVEALQAQLAERDARIAELLGGLEEIGCRTTHPSHAAEVSCRICQIIDTALAREEQRKKEMK